MMQQKHYSSQCKNTNADVKHKQDQLPQHINSHKCTKMQTEDFIKRNWMLKKYEQHDTKNDITFYIVRK